MDPLIVPDISIIILAKNEQENIQRCLDGIFEQQLDETFEVILIDSGSTDRTREIASGYAVRIHEIRPAEFQHGRTRNLGANLARGRLLVYLVADAYPASKTWLRTIIEPLKSEKVGAVYSRHLPKPGAIPPMDFAVRHRYGEENREQRVEADGQLHFDNIRLSNVSSAFRRDVVLQHPFPENLIMGEDFGIGKLLLEAGYEIQYVGDVAVYHSHNYSVQQVFRRYFDLGVAFEEVWGKRRKGISNMSGKSLNYLFAEVKYFVKNRRFAWLLGLPFYEGARYLGYAMGRRHKWLPSSMRRRCSMYRGFWDIQLANGRP